MELPHRRFQGEALEHLCRAARLDLSEERKGIVGPVLEGIYALIDALDEVQLNDTPPATAFDARWE